MALIFLFIDGVGMGAPQKSNPFHTKKYPVFEKAAGDQAFLQGFEPVVKESHLFKAVDARLSTEGLPQSGTGQATMFSGQNAAKLVGRHFGPYPHSRTRFLLEEESLFKSIQRIGRSCYFMNAYPKIFFDRAKLKNRWSCTTLMTLGADIPLNTVEEVINGHAITAEILQDVWHSVLDLEVPQITVEQAAHRVLTKAGEHDLILAEYYLTDKAGHEKDPVKADWVLQRFNDFLGTILSKNDENHTVLLVSDHGNVEDLSTKSHTMNDVPLFVHGPGAYLFDEVNSLVDIKPVCLRWFAQSGEFYSGDNISNGI
ncbi:MAG: alkaline phosphatase family protein [Balneolales bacterium]